MLTALALLGGLLVIVGVGIIVALLLIAREIRRAARQSLELGLAQLEARRQEMAAQVTVREQEVVGRLGQLALEATGERPGIDQVIRVTAGPAPAIVALGKGFAHYVFTSAPPQVARRVAGLLGDHPRRVRAWPVDATSSLTATAELAAIWTLLAGSSSPPVPEAERVLPRSARWYLYIVPQPTGRPAR